MIKWGRWALPAALLALVVPAATGCESSTPGAAPKPTAAVPSASVSTSVARVCAKPAAGPAKAPAGAVTVDPAVVGLSLIHI